MANIEFSDAKYQQLTKQAAAAGFSDMSAFLEALADEASYDLRDGMTDEMIRQSAKECDANIKKSESKVVAKKL